MKPRDLQFPFKEGKRYVTVQDRIWYVPTYSEYPFCFPGWHSPLFFSKEQPVKIEYCSGNGAWIVAKALQYPQFNWVAIERKFERVRKLWSKIKNHCLDNLLVLCGEGYQATQHYLPSYSVEEVFINFPDPWPKKRHGKNRLIQSPFIQEVHRILKPGGTLTAVTDDVAYSQIIVDVLYCCPGFTSTLPFPYFVTEWAGYGNSYFEDLWRQKGKQIRYHQFIKSLSTI